MPGYSTKNKTFRKGALKDANVSVIGDGYGGSEKYNGIDQYGNIWIRSQEGQPQHFNGTVDDTTPVVVTPSAKSTQILIYNPATNNNNDLLRVSFDSGTTYFDIERKGRLSIETEVSSFQLLSNNNSGINYQILVTRITEALTD